MQQVELVAGQHARRVAEGDFARRRSDLQPAEAHRLRGVRPCTGAAGAAAEDRAKSREELAGVERLGEIVVGAELQADDPIGVVAPRGQHEHRHVGGGPDAAAHLEAVQIGQHHVEDHGGRLHPRQGGEPGRGVVRDIDLHAGRRMEVLADHRSEARVVLDHQDPLGHGRTVACRGGRRRRPRRQDHVRFKGGQAPLPRGRGESAGNLRLRAARSVPVPAARRLARRRWPVWTPSTRLSADAPRTSRRAAAAARDRAPRRSRRWRPAAGPSPSPRG